MDRDCWILITLIALLLFITNINTAKSQRDIEIEKIKDAVIKNSEITCIEYLQDLED